MFFLNQNVETWNKEERKIWSADKVRIELIEAKEIEIIIL